MTPLAAAQKIYHSITVAWTAAKDRQLQKALLPPNKDQSWTNVADIASNITGYFWNISKLLTILEITPFILREKNNNFLLYSTAGVNNQPALCHYA